MAVVVDAKDASAEASYKRYDFRTLQQRAEKTHAKLTQTSGPQMTASNPGEPVRRRPKVEDGEDLLAASHRRIVAELQSWFVLRHLGAMSVGE